MKDFFEDKTYPKLKLLEKLGYALGIVGNNDFFFQGDISHLGYKIKKGGRGGGLVTRTRLFSWEKMSLCCHIMNNFSLKSPYLDNML